MDRFFAARLDSHDLAPFEIVHGHRPAHGLAHLFDIQGCAMNLFGLPVGHSFSNRHEVRSGRAQDHDFSRIFGDRLHIEQVVNLDDRIQNFWRLGRFVTKAAST